MEDEATDAPERVRILSTLAANRPPSKRASGRARARRGRGTPWQFKALLILMGLGIVGLLAGFAMVLSRGHPEAHPQGTLEPTSHALTKVSAANTALPSGAAAVLSGSASSPLTAASTASHPPVPTPPAPQAAVIENVAPAAIATVSPVAASPLAALNTVSPAAPPSPALPPIVPPKQQASPRPTVQAQSEPRRMDKALARPVKVEARKPAPATKRGQDADVALLEAMFTHARPAHIDADKRRPCAQQPQSAGCTTPR